MQDSASEAPGLVKGAGYVVQGCLVFDEEQQRADTDGDCSAVRWAVDGDKDADGGFLMPP